MDEITKIETIDQYDQLFGLETLHPLVNVIDFSKATKTVEYYHMNIGFYSLFLKDLKSATPFPKCYLHKEKWTFDS